MDWSLLTIFGAVLLVAGSANVAERHRNLAVESGKTLHAFGRFMCMVLVYLWRRSLRRRQTHIARGFMYIRFTTFNSRLRRVRHMLRPKAPPDTRWRRWAGRQRARLKSKLVELFFRFERRHLR